MLHDRALTLNRKQGFVYSFDRNQWLFSLFIPKHLPLQSQSEPGSGESHTPHLWPSWWAGWQIGSLEPRPDWLYHFQVGCSRYAPRRIARHLLKKHKWSLCCTFELNSGEESWSYPLWPAGCGVHYRSSDSRPSCRSGRPASSAWWCSGCPPFRGSYCSSAQTHTPESKRANVMRSSERRDNQRQNQRAEWATGCASVKQTDNCDTAPLKTCHTHTAASDKEVARTTKKLFITIIRAVCILLCMIIT